MSAGLYSAPYNATCAAARAGLALTVLYVSRVFNVASPSSELPVRPGVRSGARSYGSTRDTTKLYL